MGREKLPSLFGPAYAFRGPDQAARVFYLHKVLEFKIDTILADLFEWKSNPGQAGIIGKSTIYIRGK
jgi:hypothetical protein